LVAAVGQYDVGADAQGCREVQGVEAAQMAAGSSSSTSSFAAADVSM
jgi:hypothetical protein